MSDPRDAATIGLLAAQGDKQKDVLRTENERLKQRIVALEAAGRDVSNRLHRWADQIARSQQPLELEQHVRAAAILVDKAMLEEP